MRLFFRVAFLLVHLSLLGCFVAGLAARYVHPQTAWWLQPAAVVLPIIALLVTITTVVSATLGRWMLFSAGAIALLVFAFRYVEVFRGSVSGAGESLTVATFNTEGGVSEQAGGDRGIPSLIHKVEPDILCLQEFLVTFRGNKPQTHGEVDALFDVAGYEIIAPGQISGHGRPPPIVSKVKLEQSSVHGLVAENRSDPGGTVVRAELSWNGRRFVVYNVHLQGYSMNRPWGEGKILDPRAWVHFLRRSSGAIVQRAAEAEAIRDMIGRENLPFLLCGDFNTTSHQWVYGELARGLQDTFLASGRVWGPTYPARAPLVRIDYILASPEWRVLRAEVGPDLPPDHRPLVVHLGL